MKVTEGWDVKAIPPGLGWANRRLLRGVVLILGPDPVSGSS